MKMYITFDAVIDSYEIKSNLYMVSGIEGVSSTQLYEKVSGDAPRYCIELDVADDQAASVGEKLSSVQAQYSGYISNTHRVAYKAV